VIFIDHYHERLNSIFTQFQFARKAIKGFIEQNEPDTEMPAPPPKFTLASLMGKSGIEDLLTNLGTRAEFAKGGFPTKYKKLENRLAQNEVVLIVAVFEDQLKAIHREVLRQNPLLLNPDRQIKLGKLVALKQDKVIEDEIESAVQALDRQSAKERARAFAKLDLPWGSQVDAVEHVTHLRNRILHENIDVEVKGWDLTSAQIVSVLLPLNLYFRAEELYPSGFDSGVSHEEMEHTRSLVQETMKNAKPQQPS
jgi:hypothetical protein